MNGDVLTLSSTGKSGLVQNDGNIQASGFVTLVGDQVRNTGSITVPGGQVVLAAGDSATVALANGQGLSLTLTDATANALVENSGQIVADNGSVLLTARGSDTLLKTVINMSGVVQAGSGAIVADAGSTGDVIVTGKLDTSNMSAGGVGGDVVLSGNRIGLSDTARIDVSGDGDAGYAVIGGDTKRKVPGSKAGELIDNMTFADVVQIDRGAQIMARSVHGNGGFLETSGRYLNMQGQVDASAPNGKNGSWLIDPTDVTISDTADANYSGGLGDGPFAGAGNTAVVSNRSIENTLNGGGDVEITTSGNGTTAKGNISVAADIVTTSDTNVNLTLVADNNLYIGDKANVTIGATGNGALNANMVATNGTAYVGGAGRNVTFDTRGNVSITGGRETSSAVGLQLAGDVNVFSGNVALTGTANNNVGVNEQANSAINVTGGHLDINGQSGSGIGVSISNLTVGGSASVGVVAEYKDPTISQAPGLRVSNVTVNGTASVTMSATAPSGDGIQIGGNVNVSEDGRFTLIAESNEYVVSASGESSKAGINVSANVSVSDNGNLTMSGSTASTSIGVLFSGGRLDVSNNARVVINGEANSTKGVGVDFGLAYKGGSISGNGTISINGTNPQGGGRGGTGGPTAAGNVGGVVISGGGWDISGNGALSVSGDSGNGIGVNLSSPMNVSSGGTVDISGNSTNGTGTLVGGSLNISGNGASNISGSSANGTGVQINGVVNVSGTSTANIAGNSADGNGTVIHGRVNTSGNGTVDIGGNSANSTGTLVDSNASISTTENGSTSIAGNSTDGTGVLVNGSFNVSGNGSANVSGNSTNGTGAQINGTLNVSNTSTVNIAGNSADGNGTVIFGSVNASENGTVDIGGYSASSTGTLVGVNGSVSATDNAAASINGNSAAGAGVFVDGLVNVSGNASGNISGNSTNGTSVVQGGNGTFTASDDSTLNITAPGASKDDFNVGRSGNAKVNIDTSIPDNNGNTTPVNPTNPTDPTEPTNNTPGDGGVTNPTGGVSGGGHNYAGAVVGGVLGAAGIGALVMSTHAVVYLEQPVALSVDSGDLTYWGNVSLEHLQIDLKGDQAELVLHTPDGSLKRQLKLLDGADGVKHYTSVDPDVGMKSDLTFNPKTSEYFYTESSAKAGRAYKVSAHGWLKERTSLGAPATLPDTAARATQAL
ncbi:beta strand repeat-containing protein [Pandoraea communis]|uniref:beta strand repeat-containing protein n=1 Tax=Pandoraea communis TaxID=2508297 RepID=UPI0025A4DBE4|nr:hypothetical protein [Pandoraea communis]MDM8359763.1 hypothetical protein [Pandoraea communis]